MGSLMGSFGLNSKLTHRSHQDQSGEYIENLLTIYPLGKVWVNCSKTLNKLSMYLSGKTPSAPSEREIEANIRGNPSGTPEDYYTNLNPGTQT